MVSSFIYDESFLNVLVDFYGFASPYTTVGFCMVCEVVYVCSTYTPNVLSLTSVFLFV